MHKQNYSVGQYSAILCAQNMGDEKINRICKNVLCMQHQPESCASDLSDCSHVTCITTIVVGRPLMPSVYRLQQLIESAWARGYDETGCRQLGGKLVGTRKWIGATEIYAVLSFLGVR